MRNSKESFKKSYLILILIIAIVDLGLSQVPISQVEGFLEVYHSIDTTSLYIGKGAGQSSQELIRGNTFLGTNTGRNNIQGTRNVFIGFEAGLMNNSGFGNSLYGFQAGNNNTVGSLNSFFGDKAGFSNLDGIQNSFFGSEAGFSVTGGLNNSYFGHRAGYFVGNGIANSFYGAHSGLGNFQATGSYNSFFGVESGREIDSGDANSFFGYQSGTMTEAGNNNSFFGLSSGHENTSGSNNCFVGADTGFNNQSGSYNSYFGAAAGQNILGSNNIAIGSFAGPLAPANLISQKLYIDIISSDDPLIYGEFDNDLIEINGRFTIDAPDLNGQVYLTFATERGWAFRQFGNGANTALRLTGVDPNNNNKHFLIDTDGNVGIDFNHPTAKLHVGGNIIATGTISGSSDVNRKEVFTSIDPHRILEKVSQLEITEWQYKDSEGRHVGPMAHDFYKSFQLGQDDKTIATVDADGIALLAIQALQQETEMLKEYIRVLELRLDRLEEE